MFSHTLRRLLNSFAATPVASRVWLLLALPALVWAGPQDGQVAAGSANISSSGTRTDIVQSSERAVINWGGFSIGEGEVVQFLQPSARSVTLNRVTGGEGSRIAGDLLANGHVMLINPNGIAFTSTAKIDVGSLTATTADIADSDFMAGRHVFSDAPANSMVINAGRITVRDAGLAHSWRRTCATRA